jgi:hypothetical protein
MAVTTARTRDEFMWLLGNAAETAISTCLDTQLTYVDRTTGLHTPGTRKVTRSQVAKALARVLLRKATQGAMRPEMRNTPPSFPVNVGDTSGFYVKPTL